VALQEFIGYSAEELLNFEYFWEPIHPSSREMVKNYYLERVTPDEVPLHYDLKVLDKSGAEKWLDIFITIEVINGQRYTIIGAYDITEQKNARLALQAANDRLDEQVQARTQELTLSNRALMEREKLLMNIISNISDGVVIVTQQGKIEFINHNLQVMFEKNSTDIRNDLDCEALISKNPGIKQMLFERKAFNDEEVIVTINGREVQFLASGTPMEDWDGTIDKGIIVLKPLAEIHRLVNRFSGSEARFCFKNILTQSGVMLDTIELAKNASQNKSTVLIQGESGTGKEMFAQAIHNYSTRPAGPFIAVNCGAIPRELIGSELFGYVEGAFTGARKGGNPGKFELAQGGTLFLDEIGDMPLEQQVVLLRVLQEKQVCRLGGSKTIPINVRVICSTNKDLYNEVKEGNFRQDLFYRLNVINLRIPPLREHNTDVELLLKHFLIQEDQRWLDHISDIDSSVWNLLKSYRWPGNVRELQNFAARINYTVKDYSLKPENIPHEMKNSFESSYTDSMPTTHLSTNLKQQLADLESHQIKLLLQQYNGNLSRVAQVLGVSRRTVARRIKLYGIEEGSGRGNS
ncbi:MAG TPA: sigma 54-interacting transcriptional regulator, partial [Syntrophomonas sp.]|nr:sigma 54-interacting transcriptional regulator [Syntrophomonas sp.]